MNVFVNTDRAVLAAMIFAVLFGQVVIYPGVPELVAALGAPTTLDASMWFLAAEYAGAVLCAGVWGALSDTAGRRVPFIVAGALGGVASYATLIGLGEVTSIGFGMLLVLRFIGGSFTIGAFSLSITMLMDLGGGHGRNMGGGGDRHRGRDGAWRTARWSTHGNWPAGTPRRCCRTSLCRGIVGDPSDRPGARAPARWHHSRTLQSP